MESACKARRSLGSSTIRRITSCLKSSLAVSHDTEFHQFMLYTPGPGTPQMAEEGRLLKDADYADAHGQFKIQFQARRNFA